MTIDNAFSRIAGSCSACIALALTACAANVETDEPLGRRTSAVLGVDTHLYFRCNATGWGVDDATRVAATEDPNVFELEYQVTESWMTTGSDSCVFTETNQFNGWGSLQRYYNKAQSGVLQVPGGDQLVLQPAGQANTFAVRYPALGNYRVTVDWLQGSFSIDSVGPVASDRFQYLRSNATGWEPNGSTHLLATGTPDVSSLTYEVTQSWMTSGADSADVVDTNELNGWGTQQQFYGNSTTGLFLVPGSVTLTTQPPSGSFQFPVRYPALGTYTALVDWAAKTLSIQRDVPVVYRGLTTFDQFDFFAEFPPRLYHTYTTPHFVFYAHEFIDLVHVTRMFGGVERCYQIHAEVSGPDWVERTESHPELGLEQKTIAFVEQMAVLDDGSTFAGLGNNRRVEVGPVAQPDDPSELGSRENNWIMYYEAERGDGYPWYEYLFFLPGPNDWNNGYAHFVAIRCSEMIGAGPHHGNVTLINSLLPIWVNLPSGLSWVDAVAAGEFTSPEMEDPIGVDGVIGAMLAELHRRHGGGLMQRLARELVSGRYEPATTPRIQACNFLRATDAVTGSASHDLFVQSWRFPNDCP